MLFEFAAINPQVGAEAVETEIASPRSVDMNVVRNDAFPILTGHGFSYILDVAQ